MSGIEKRLRSGKIRWYARYRTPDGNQKTATFDKKVDAGRYLNRDRIGEVVRIIR